jgi:hypothetical protein
VDDNMSNVGFWDTIGRSLSGRGQFRLILQPAMAVILGIRVGLHDARQGHPPFIRRLLTTSAQRWTLFKRSVREAALPLVLALVMDSVLQYLTLRRVRPVAAVLVGGLLVWLPFVVTRAFANRIWTHAGPRRPARV